MVLRTLFGILAGSGISFKYGLAVASIPTFVVRPFSAADI
jgi:hypothetical protein